MYAPLIHFETEIAIDRIRRGPEPVKVLVRTGQYVNALDPVLEEPSAANHLLLDTARGLGVSTERANELLVCKVGQKVTPGDILAGPIGLGRRVVRAPKAGKVLDIGRGSIMLELEGGHRQLAAGLPGQITEQIPDQGVIIHTEGALIQGSWGNGCIGQGELRLLVDAADWQLTSQALDDQLSGKIIVGGYCQDEEVFKKAAALSVAGILLGSMSPRLLWLAARLKMPVALVDGFGPVPMNRFAYDILIAHNGSLAALNGESTNWFTGTRPELVIPKMPGGKPIQQTYPNLLAPGRLVQVNRILLPGQSGRLVDLVGDKVLPNGLRAASAAVKLDSGEIITIPIVNLQLISDGTSSRDGN
jgi:hypothetical protein